MKNCRMYELMRLHQSLFSKLKPLKRWDLRLVNFGNGNYFQILYLTFVKDVIMTAIFGSSHESPMVECSTHFLRKYWNFSKAKYHFTSMLICLRINSAFLFEIIKIGFITFLLEYALLYIHDCALLYTYMYMALYLTLFGNHSYFIWVKLKTKHITRKR